MKVNGSDMLFKVEPTGHDPAVKSGLISARMEAILQQMAAYAARLAQSVERETLNLKVVGSTPTSGSIPGVSKRPFFLRFCTSCFGEFSFFLGS
ncbi:hypothetical protein B0H65DRAFT_224083 [Neurospora tetraspora]|uniref:Uncharacterized protein n=1 Tax=Neurospora tetraspora TaxID=94610 RepID=A0AAE0MQQ0_9PEZI|nr:hypothetical protein B0H65DRAFT_224083 [Neurospora tetraspora]